VRELLDTLRRDIGALHSPTALLCATNVRFAVRQLVEADLPLLIVLSHAEIPPQVRVISLGTVS
jgi:flagellar biosynthesis component FlhA